MIVRQFSKILSSAPAIYTAGAQHATKLFFFHAEVLPTEITRKLYSDFSFLKRVLPAEMDSLSSVIKWWVLRGHTVEYVLLFTEG